jgi:hypothetical protein
MKISGRRPFLGIGWHFGIVKRWFFLVRCLTVILTKLWRHCMFSCCSRTNILSSENNISSPACQLSRISMIFFSCSLISLDHFSAPTRRFHGSISSLLSRAFSPNLLTYLLDDQLSGFGPFSGLVLTFSGSSSFNVTFESPIYTKFRFTLNFLRSRKMLQQVCFWGCFFMINYFTEVTVCV